MHIYAVCYYAEKHITLRHIYMRNVSNETKRHYGTYFACRQWSRKEKRQRSGIVVRSDMVLRSSW